VRRILFALLIALVTPLVLLTPPASAAAIAKPAKVAKPVIQPAHLTVNPVTHALLVAAVSVGVSVRELRAEWQHVAICEVSGNWSMTGPLYSGIGFLNTTWDEYGGARYAPLAGEASVVQQIIIAMRVTHGLVPDQNGCSPGGW
jgi:hypothetical protein